MAAQGDLPRYFCTLTSLRPLASCVFFYIAYNNGHTAVMMDLDMNITWQQYRMLHSSFILSAAIAVWAAIWGFINILGEASQAVRKSALKGCWRSDIFVLTISVLCIVLNRVAVSRSRCSEHGSSFGQGLGREQTMNLEMWCWRYEYGFRLTVLILVLAAIPLIFSTRWFINKRLSESRAVSHDWTKNHSPRSQPHLAILQCLAAPVRFVWRCCCKLGHSSKNPTVWAMIFALFSVPFMIGFALLGICRVGKEIGKGAHALTGSKSRKPTTEGVTERLTSATARMATNNTNDDIEMIDSRATEHESAPAPIKRKRARSPVKRAAPQASGYWHDKIKRSRPAVTARAPTLLDRLVEHPTLFFELLSHLHGADVRVLSTVSHSVRDVMLFHRANHPRAIRKYTCMRADSWGASRASPQFSATSSSGASPNSLSTAIRNILGSDASPAEHKSHTCWSCGVVVCPDCSESKPLLRVSKAELRLHSLQPVCSACYFKCLCGPHVPQLRRWYGRSRQKHRKIFPSLSAKCACTSQKPPKMEHDLCRDCCKLSLPDMWKKRSKRGAVAEACELPPNTAADAVYDDSDSDSDFASASTSHSHIPQDGQQIDIEAVAGVRTKGDVIVAKEELPLTKPILATNITHCYACQERLWILPTWLGFGQTRGLRWWRCRRCGLEARDVLMSLRREFQ